METVTDTGHLTGRRVLRFATLDEAQANVDLLVTAERAGHLTTLGNWTLGQSLGHLATWIDFAYDGYPLNPPLWIKLILRPMKNRFIYKPMRAGVKIPKVAGGTLGTELLSTDDGVARLRRSFDRLRHSPPTKPNLLFGRLSADQWTQLQLRHAELHLSFFRVD